MLMFAVTCAFYAIYETKYVENTWIERWQGMWRVSHTNTQFENLFYY